ncbi:MAG: DUF5688 family protein [Lachnospiraceae bacterium]|nr:DUF5688 family protein [Lachnospiraceae bacterium]
MNAKEERIAKRCMEEMSGVLVKEVETKKNNGQILRGLGIDRPDSRETMIMYWVDIERSCGKNYTEEQAVKYILEQVKERKEFFLEDNDILNWDWARSWICKKVVNYKRNQKRLEDFPHRRYLDLAELYYLYFPLAGGGMAAAEIPLALMNYWGTTPEELEQIARENMDAQGYYLKTMDAVMAEQKLPELGGTVPLYVLSNKENELGAAAITDPELLGRLTEGVDEDFYILPSSVHELLLLPTRRVPSNVEGLRQVVRHVNWNAVKREEFLSDNVYRYSRLTGNIKLEK